MIPKSEKKMRHSIVVNELIVQFISILNIFATIGVIVFRTFLIFIFFVCFFINLQYQSYDITAA